jgi:8-oxo-dGTP diphosphatase
MMQVRRHPLLTIDVVIRTRGGVVLVKRAREPYKGKWAIPGGFVCYGERVEAAALREAKEETGLKVKLQKLIGVYSDPKRDPRGHVVSACFLAKATGGRLKAASDAAEVKIFQRIPWSELAFDHAKILRDAIR